MKTSINIKNLFVTVGASQASHLLSAEPLAARFVASGFGFRRPTPEIGEYWEGEGGIFIGWMPERDGGSAYPLVAASGPESEIKAAFGGGGHETKGAGSAHDGAANTLALLSDGKDHPAASFAAKYTADGHGDFYLPARRELMLCEINVPSQFTKGLYWSSTQRSAYYAYLMVFEVGWQGDDVKNAELLVRPVRRVLQ